MATAPKKAADRHRRSGGQGQGMNWCWRPTREAIYLRDGDACVYCRRHASTGCRLTLDHVTPHCLGGDDKPTNLVTACFDCNSLRRDLPVEEFALTLYDRGIDAAGVSGRIAAALARPVDRKAGKARAEQITGRRF